jgi:hypothetical protein
MTNHNLLATFKGKTRILMHRYGERGIKDEEILEYINATLHKYLPSDDAEAIMKDFGTVRLRYKLEHDPNDPNGLYKIYKVTPDGYLLSGSQRLIASFWIDANDKDISPKEFLADE